MERSDAAPGPHLAAAARPRQARTAAAAAAAAAALLALTGALGGCAPAGGARTPADGGSVTTPASTAGGGAAPTARPGGQPAARPMARSVPRRLRIPALGIDTAVMALGLQPDGEAAVPPIAAHAPAGWYDGSPTPGQTGPSVILGHVTVGSYGDGVFLHLARLRPGDRVSVTRADGSVAAFAVDSVQTVSKSDFPTGKVYGNVDRPALRLITCGGSRVAGGGGYRDNVIVYASLVAAP